MSSLIVNPYWFIALFAVTWLTLKFYETFREVKLRKRIKLNSYYYLWMLATTLDEVKLVNKRVLTKDDVRKIINTLNKFPKIQEVKRIITALNHYLNLLDKYYVQMRDNPMEVRERFIIPLCKNLVYLFGIIDEDIRIFSAKRRRYYERKKLTERTYTPKILRDIIQKITGMKK